MEYVMTFEEFEEKLREDEAMNESHSPGDKVSTPKGNGTIIEWDEEKEAHKVQLDEGEDKFEFFKDDELTPVAEEYKPFELGATVETEKGNGEVVSFDEIEKVYKIQLSEGNVEDFPADDVKEFVNESHLEPGCKVTTPKGAGQVISWNDIKEEYTVQLDDGGDPEQFKDADITKIAVNP